MIIPTWFALSILKSLFGLFFNLVRHSLWFGGVYSKPPCLHNIPPHFGKQSSYSFHVEMPQRPIPFSLSITKLKISLKTVFFYREPFWKAIVFILNSYNGLQELVEGQQLQLKTHKYLMVQSQLFLKMKPLCTVSNCPQMLFSLNSWFWLLYLSFVASYLPFEEPNINQ